MTAALVTIHPKPKDAWTTADAAYMEAQSHLPLQDQRPLQEPWLVDRIHNLQVDPRVWGLRLPEEDNISLLELTVRHARQRIVHTAQRSSTGASVVPGYAEESAVWPRAWHNSPTEDPATPPHLRGLEGRESIWCTAVTPAPQPDPPETIDRIPTWLDLSRPHTPRPSPQDRVQLRQEQPTDILPAAALRPGFAAAWKRLDDPTLHRPFRITSWRILHACLGCKAFLAYVRGPPLPNIPGSDPPTLLFCDHLPCRSTGEVETISHALLYCTAVSPAIEWLRLFWEAVSGIPVPDCRHVLLADDLTRWPNHPTEGALRLWTHLRVTLLGCIWRARCSRDEYPALSIARRAVLMTLQHVREAIQRDWSRTLGAAQLHANSSFCVDWWRGFDISLSRDAFKKQWCSPAFFCKVVIDPPTSPSAAPVPRLVLLLLPADGPATPA